MMALWSVERQVANDREFSNFENDVDTASWTVLGEHTRRRFVEERKRKQGLVIALDLGLAVRITGPGLNVVKNVVFSQTPITNDVDAFYEALWLGLLGGNLSGGGKDSD